MWGEFKDETCVIERDRDSKTDREMKEKRQGRNCQRITFKVFSESLDIVCLIAQVSLDHHQRAELINTREETTWKQNKTEGYEREYVSV